MSFESMTAVWVESPPWSAPTKFWPLDLVKALPYGVWKPHKSQEKLVTTRFFTKDKLWAQQWHIYYFWAQEVNPTKPLLLVTESQAKEFINTVQDAFPNLPLAMPNENQWPGLIADFESFQQTVPHPLGTPVDAEHFNKLKAEAVPDTASLSSRFGTAYVARLKSMVLNTSDCLTRKQKKAKESAEEAANAVACAAFVELQKNLGLRSPSDDNLDNVTLLATNCKVPWTPEDAPVFISIDVEWDELNTSAITEVGVSTLDVYDILGTPPGQFGCNWQQRIRARHFWIEEYRHVKNTRWVHGCPEAFQFGKSEIVRKADMSRILASCFKLPYGRRGNHGRQAEAPGFRPVVLVGHQPRGDIDKLRQMGFDPTALANVNMIQDTAQIHAFLAQSPNKPGLAAVLEELDIDAWFLHNGGNDAYYTLAALLGLAVAHRQGILFGGREAGKKAAQAAAVDQLADELISL